MQTVTASKPIAFNALRFDDTPARAVGCRRSGPRLQFAGSSSVAKRRWFGVEGASPRDELNEFRMACTPEISLAYFAGMVVL
jgi:hypothetical protein